jgi:thymidine kinase
MRKEFVLYLGPMFSGKTTRLLSSIERHLYKKEDVICFKPHIDGRYSNTEIVTHSSSKVKAYSVKNAKEIEAFFDKAFLTPKIVAVDEAFMIEGCGDYLNKLFMESNVTIYVSSIEMSANLNPFPEVQKMMPYATKIEKCTSICLSCYNDAQLTYRKAIEPLINKEISVGGSETYEPRCWSCHPLVNKDKK